jgi:hypothetical protein
MQQDSYAHFGMQKGRVPTSLSPIIAKKRKLYEEEEVESSTTTSKRSRGGKEKSQ